MSEAKQALISIGLLDDLVTSLTNPAHVKDASNYKYVLSNKANIQMLGLSKPEDIYGLTIFDLDKQLRPRLSHLAEGVHEFDQKIKFKGEVIVEKNRALIDGNDRLFVHHMTKIPVLNKDKVVSHILTINENITSQIDLVQLWQFYKDFYKVQPLQVAIVQMLKHIKISDYFIKLPTEAELFVLLTKYRNSSSAKAMANSLYLSPRTIETHISRLKAKSKIDLSELLNLIRIS